MGAAVDSVRRDLRRKHGLSLDMRDRSWFLDRVLGSAACERAAEELAEAVVDPLLAEAGVTSTPPSGLTSQESIAALTLLGLQWRDDVRDKGLTKLAFEALVRSVLSKTDSENRMERKDVHAAVRRLLPGHSATQVDGFVDSALRRLAKRSVRHWKKEDQFCLAHDERVKVSEFKTESALLEGQLNTAVNSIAGAVLTARAVPPEHIVPFAGVLRGAIDSVLFDRSQAFALAVHSGQMTAMVDADTRGTLLAHLARSPLPKVKDVDWLDLLGVAVRELLISDEPAIDAFLRSLADAYTLLAFLRQTPDVQSAVEKMFSHGKVWLDASVALPLFAEPLAETVPGRFTRMLLAAREAGLELYITPGAVEEIERHMNRALTCLRLGNGRWVGAVPYLLERFLASGRAPATFSHWLETFRGDVRPEQDISDYLEEEFGIEARGLEVERDKAPAELRHALQELWYHAHRQRRTAHGVVMDEATITRLVEHDVECYSGVVQVRRQERASAFGYSAWWLTVDRRAFELKDRLRERMSSEPPDSPVLSADFMVNYLAFGPVRRRVPKEREAQLPLLMELGTARYLTPELMAQAEQIREDLKNLPDRVVRRRVRDHLDMARRRIGPVAMAGVAPIDEEDL